MKHIGRRFHTTSTDLFNWIRLSGFDFEFSIDAPVTLITTGFLNLRLRAVAGVPDGPVGWAVRVGLRGPYASASAIPAEPSFGVTPPSAAWNPAAATRLVGGKSSGNIASLADHYGTADLNSVTALTTPGFYRLSVWGDSHTSIVGAVPGMIEVNGDGGSTDPYNELNIFTTPI